MIAIEYTEHPSTAASVGMTTQTNLRGRNFFSMSWRGLRHTTEWQYNISEDKLSSQDKMSPRTIYPRKMCPPSEEMVSHIVYAYTLLVLVARCH